jgi:mannose-6-phosphate isomerase-like protein (cupin superfamily)
MKPEYTHMEPKVWGFEVHICNQENLYCGKVMMLKQDHRCSIHYHVNKHETFYISSGYVLMETASKPYQDKIDQIWKLPTGFKITIPQHTIHRFSGIRNSNIFEISTFDDPNDSYRLTQSEYVENGSVEWGKEGKLLAGELINQLYGR